VVREDINAALRCLPLFGTLPPAPLAELTELVEVHPVVKGELLFSEGDEARFLPLLLAGQVKLARTAPDGREQVLYLVRAPASFAEAAVFGPGVFPVSATVMQRGRLATIPRDALLKLLRRRPEVSLAMLASVSIWLRRLVDLVEGLSLHTVEERVAAYLWSVFTRSGTPLLPGSQAHLEEPKHLVAALCGTVPEVLSRTFRRLEEEGVVRVEGAVVVLLDPRALARRARTSRLGR
jgi:CRP-like cAMP-binding protein